MQSFLFLVIGILAGIAIGWLIGKLMAAGKKNTGPDGQDLQQLQMNLHTLQNKLQLVQEEKLRQEKLFSEQFEKQQSAFQLERQKYNEQLLNERNIYTEAEKNIARLTAVHHATEEKLEVQKKEIDNLQQKFKLEFENIANKLLEEKSQKFTDINKNQMDIILNPLKEKIQLFEKKVDDTYQQEFREKASLKEEIKNLVDLNQKISQEANNLVTALKGNNKTQGNWGEMILEKVLEVSGLTKDVEYKTQFSTSNEEGKRLQPDVVIMLPEGKNLVIDAKVSLIAYEQFINAETDENRDRFLKMHIDSMRVHIRGLGDKNYTELAGVKTPDFILMFIPVEASFAAALQADPELYNFAWDRKIVLVSPTTLLATLRTVSSVWKQEKQVKNALLIAEQAGSMYDKFVAVVEDLIRVGTSIDTSKKAYSEAMNKFVEGRGNLVKRAEDLKELGIKTSKKFDQKLINRATPDIFENNTTTNNNQENNEE